MQELMDKIAELLEQGYELRVGRHSNDHVGFWAVLFVSRTRPNCHRCNGTDFEWREVVHAETLQEAMGLAYRQACGETVPVPDPRDFLRPARKER